MNKEFKIYTKTGDDGTSGLIGGTRVKKYDVRLEAYGTVDELNSWIGVINEGVNDSEVQPILEFIQNKLFFIGSYLATDETKSDLKTKIQFNYNEIEVLEKEIDKMNKTLPALTNFILPGGTIVAGYSHIARTICRRAERRIAAISETIPVHPNILIFINRLSDYLFVLSRYINHQHDRKETLWNSKNC